MSKQRVTMCVPIEIEVPSVPNFLMVSRGGINDLKVPLSSLSDEQLDSIGAQWTARLKERAREMQTKESPK